LDPECRSDPTTDAGPKIPSAGDRRPPKPSVARQAGPSAW